MIDFRKISSISITEGEVAEIRVGGEVWWKKAEFCYVSLGDSIAAGHAITDSWESDYGEGSQYGKNGNASTAIVPNCYTDLIYDGLVGRYGASGVRATSFARSGDTVADLMAKLDHGGVRDAIGKASLVTVCIGANDVLQPALMDVGEYISTGSLANAESAIEANMARLADDSAATGYKALMDRLRAINPDATYVFMSVYNPYKYLWLDESRNGFFAPLLSTIPNMSYTVPIVNYNIDIDGLIKDGLLSTPAVQTVFSRVNGLCDWAEARVVRLNEILRAKVAAAGEGFMVADAKAAFDSVPDRPVTAPYHYNDLVNVEYTRGYDTMQMDWGALWRDRYGDNVAQYWLDLAMGYVSWSGLDVSGLAEELVTQMVEKVIVPDVDPHPEPYGHLVLARTFSDVLE